MAKPSFGEVTGPGDRMAKPSFREVTGPDDRIANAGVTYRWR